MRKKISHPVTQMFNATQKRFVRARPGSVLILVVALLVLMALIGTAFMTMAQFDRAAAATHSFNTEVDLLLDGVINQVKGTVGNDVFSSGQFRPAVIIASSTGQPVTYNTPQMNSSPRYWNGLGLDNGNAAVVGAQAGDWWLASRVPGLPSETSTPNPATNPPWWPYVTGPINGGASFDQPYWPGGIQPTPLSLRSQLVPSYTQQPAGTNLYIDGKIQPAFQDVTALTSGSVTLNTSNFWMAADTDGDGIADAGLVKLVTLDGVTYYAAVRIVDNAAALNANIALIPNSAASYTAGTLLPGDLSPANLDLDGMIVPNASNANDDLYGGPSANGPGLLVNYRWNGQNSPSATPIGDNNIARTDFKFPTDSGAYFNAQWSQLGRRLQNPGYIAPGIKYQSLPLTEDLTMIRGFVLRDPKVAVAAASPSVLEQRMPSTLFNSAPTIPYLPSDTINWYNRSFDYFGDFSRGKNSMPKRPLIVGSNPVSNFAPDRFNLNATTSPFQFGDVQVLGGYSYVCICPGTTTAPRPPTDRYWSDPYWAWEPWTNAPTKTSVNTATFQQLYAAYWAVMADQYVPATKTTPGQWLPAFPNSTKPNAARMFRSPIRGIGSAGAATQPSDPALSNQQVMQLRAALAAVNTMDLRDADDDVTSRTIFLPNASGTPQYQVNIYGTEKQPYLTHIYARNDATPAAPGQPNGDWMAVEFYNPYPTAITLNNWVLATLDRTKPGSFTLNSLGTLATLANPSVTTIPANSFLVLLSSATPPKGVTLGSAPPKAQFVEVSSLTQAFGKELFLMRPRLASGTLLNNSTDQNNVYTESTSAPDDLIPVDSYDFTNMPATAPDAKNIQEWQYIRPDSPGSGKAWHYVYPSAWMLPSAAGAGAGAGAGNTAKPPTWSGTYATVPAPVKTDLSNGSGLSNFGTPQPGPATGVTWTNYHDVPIQVNNIDFGGPAKPTTGGPNYSPLGAFPRNGDILQVTYIGAYKISPVGAPHTIVELNTISSDSAMATACDQTDGQQPIAQQPAAAGGTQIVAENVGRFCPIDMDDAKVATPAIAANDFSTVPMNWRYHWASRLFDFLTVQGPQDDYTPDVDPWSADRGYPTNYRYPPANSSNFPVPVANVTAGAANAGLTVPNLNPPPTAASEDTAAVNGLVNINSAPWRVLAAVPWFPATTPNYRTQNANVAIGLAYYRDVNDGTGGKVVHGHGPFQNLFELGEATIATMGNRKLRDIIQIANTNHFNLPRGNLTPVSGNGTGNVSGDFQALFNTITRVSNLVTTRSDSYTAYILIQGWQNAETSNPHLVVQRRAAVILDRSVVTPTNRSPNTVNMPMD